LIKIDFLKLKEAWDKYPPLKFEKFIFRYFSSETKQKDCWLCLSIIIMEMCLIITCIVLNHAKIAFYLAFAVVVTLIPIIYCRTLIKCIHNTRIRKIAKYLGVTVKELNKYYPL